MDFYPRSPCGERRLNLPSRPIDKNISIHALLAESDLPTDGLFFFGRRFLSTLSLRRATQRRLPDKTHQRISIHALLAESDMDLKYKRDQTILFLSTLSLRRATLCAFTSLFGVFLFLSTLSLRRATKLRNPSRPGKINFYPRSPCGERRDVMGKGLAEKVISIHALLAESDRLL